MGDAWDKIAKKAKELWEASDTPRGWQLNPDAGLSQMPGSDALQDAIDRGIKLIEQSERQLGVQLAPGLSIARTKDGYKEFIKYWDRLPPDVKVATIAAGCGLATVVTQGRALVVFAECGTALGLGEIYAPRPIPEGDSTPDKPNCPSGTFVGGNCQPRPANTPSQTSKQDTTPEQTPTTTPPTTTTPPKTVTNADLAKANRDYHAGRITPEEMEAIKARYRCQLGIQSYC